MRQSLPLEAVELIQSLAADFGAGRHEQVIAGLMPLLHKYPGFAPAHKLLGGALQAQGRWAEAVAALREAVRLAPGDAQAFSNLGNALADLGQFDAALAAQQQAICLQPGNATFRYNLGCLYLRQQYKPEALTQFCLAFERSPQDRELARLCRELLLELGDTARAQAFCRLNVQQLPDDAGAWAMLGGLLLEDPQASHDEAEAVLREAVRLAPDEATAWSNLGVALQNGAKFLEALQAGERAVALAPDWALAYSNLGTALRDAGFWPEAKTAFLQALERDADCVDAYYNLGCVCVDLGEHETAREAYIEALKRSPKPAWLLQGAHACRQVADWEGGELLEAELARQLDEIGGIAALSGHLPSPFAYLTTPGTTAEQQLLMARHFATPFLMRAPLPRRPGARFEGRLCIGLLSSDFRDHATAHLMTGVLEALDASRFHLIAYDYSPPRDDAYRRRLLQAIPDWVPVAGLSDYEAACRMQADGVDIVIDLKGWTQGYRSGILAYRPAPVQMQWLGYPGTLGAAWIDYIIADGVVIPPGAEAGYSEQVLRLPGCYQPNDAQRRIGPLLPRAALGLPEQAFVLAALHQPYKITRETFALWLRLLAQIPDAVLWLLEAPAMAQAALSDRAAAAGIDPARLVWAPRREASEHLGRLAAADLALDVFPVNAHTTASDALWAGVPQVARCGQTFASRVSASIVSAAGLAELVADNDARYEALILGLARDRPRLQALRQGLAASRAQCALFDATAFARHLETGLEMAWARHQAGLAPAHLDVPG